MLNNTVAVPRDVIDAFAHERYWAGRAVEALDGFLIRPVASDEPWLTKKALAAHFSVSERTVENWQSEGMPNSLIAGKVKFRLTACEPWLVTAGHIDHRGGSHG